MADVLKKFGRYFLLDHIAQGGMAEIYRARMATVDAAGRILVIKRIQGGFGANAEFLTMFKSETQVTMSFNHANIVQIYDSGEENKQPFIAMEFVDGKNLRQLLTRFAEQKQSFPIEFAAYIIQQSAAGLSYAHAFKDKITGKSLNVVHRDISPQNLIVSFEGTVKVIDFGIAKATEENREATRAGVIKGKPSYLSPEQIQGDELDGRSDLFALGAVFWELLTGKKLFSGESDLAVLKQIESCNTFVKPPSQMNPAVPKELDHIILRLLAKQREKRFQTGDELARALNKFLLTFAPDFTADDLSQSVKELFKNEIIEDRKKIQKLSEKVEQLLLTDVQPALEISEGVLDEKAKERDTTTFVGAAKRTATIEYKVDKQEIEKKVEFDRPRGAPLPKKTQPTQFVTSGVTGTVSRSRTGTYSPSADKSGGGFAGKFIAVAAMLGAVAYFGPQYGINIPFVTDFLTAQGVIHTASVTHITSPEMKSKPTAGRTPADSVMPPTTGQADVAGANGKPLITLKINLSPPGSGTTLSINGKAIDPETLSIQVPVDSPLELSVERANFKKFTREFSIESSQLAGAKESVSAVTLVPEKSGVLAVHGNLSAQATITSEDATFNKTMASPFDGESVPVGRYTVKVVNSVLDLESTQTVTIDENKVIVLEAGLKPRVKGH